MRKEADVDKRRRSLIECIVHVIRNSRRRGPGWAVWGEHGIGQFGGQSTREFLEHPAVVRPDYLHQRLGTLNRHYFWSVLIFTPLPRLPGERLGEGQPPAFNMTIENFQFSIFNFSSCKFALAFIVDAKH